MPETSRKEQMMSTSNQPWPGKQVEIDPERFRDLVQRMNAKKAGLELADQALTHAATTRNAIAAQFDEARNNLVRYIQECGGP